MNLVPGCKFGIPRLLCMSGVWGGMCVTQTSLPTHQPVGLDLGDPKLSLTAIQ